MQKIKSIFINLANWLKARWKIVLVVLIGLIILAVWQINKSKNNDLDLTFEAPRRRDLIKTLEVSGVVDAKEKARLGFATGGKITYLGAKEGDWVNKWQTIASIDRATLQKQLEQDLNLYMKERWDWETSQDNVEDRWLDDAEQRTIDKEQWDLENQVLNVEIRTQAIRNSSIYSPFEGVLTKSPAAVTGVQLFATDYFEVVNPESLIFKGAVDEAEISTVFLEQPAEIELDAYQDMIINSQVEYVAYTSNQASTGTVFIVEFPLDGNDLNKYRIGMNGDVAIILDKKDDTLSIPFEATRERDNKFYVDVKTNNNEYEEREIQIGLETEDYVEIISGLTESDEILIPD